MLSSIDEKDRERCFIDLTSDSASWLLVDQDSDIVASSAVLSQEAPLLDFVASMKSQVQEQRSKRKQQNRDHEQELRDKDTELRLTTEAVRKIKAELCGKDMQLRQTAEERRRLIREVQQMKQQLSEQSSCEGGGQRGGAAEAGRMLARTGAVSSSHCAARAASASVRPRSPSYQCLMQCCAAAG
jgi:hypothetical protein